MQHLSVRMIPASPTAISAATSAITTSPTAAATSAAATSAASAVSAASPAPALSSSVAHPRLVDALVRYLKVPCFEFGTIQLQRIRYSIFRLSSCVTLCCFVW